MLRPDPRLGQQPGFGALQDEQQVLRRGGDTFVLRKPGTEDGPAVWRMVRESSLDLNSPYAYLMWFRYYRETSLVADRAGEPAGFVTGFMPPEDPQAYFVWQVGVSEAARGNGLATDMILTALQREACRDVRYIEATVTPSNDASLALFRGLAKKLDSGCEESVCFPDRLFPVEGHESEWLLRIGPFEPGAVARAQAERRQHRR